MSDQEWNLAALAAAFAGDLENAKIASTPGGIERQEAAGQARFVANEELPAEMRGITKEELEALGFTFGQVVDKGTFIQTKLPEGWKKQPTDHSMWSDLLDENGVKRASIFFKAAFYDYSATLYWEAK